MDVMIDLETMGNGPTAAIASIGAVAFDPAQPTLTLPTDMGEFAFYSPVDLQSCQKLGLQIDASTVYFWLQQSDAARQALLVGVERSGNVQSTENSLTTVLANFNKWLKATKPERVWAWPPTFDLVILRSAYRACDIKPGWHYTTERCLRTYLDTVTGSPKYPDDFATPADDGKAVAHNALWDAWRQATLVQYCTARLAQYRLNLVN